MITKEKFEKMFIWEKLDALETLISDRDKVLRELEVSNKEARYWKNKAQEYEHELVALKRENDALKALLKELKEELNKKPVVKTVVIEKPTIKEVVKEVKVPVHENKAEENNKKITTSFDVKLSKLRRCLDRYA